MSRVPDDLRQYINRTREMMGKGFEAWNGHRLPAVVSREVPEDVRRFIQRQREVFNQKPPTNQCAPTWLYPRDRMPTITSPIAQDLRRFFERVREALVRYPVSPEDDTRVYVTFRAVARMKVSAQGTPECDAYPPLFVYVWEDEDDYEWFEGFALEPNPDVVIDAELIGMAGTWRLFRWPRIIPKGEWLWRSGACAVQGVTSVLIDYEGSYDADGNEVYLPGAYILGYAGKPVEYRLWGQEYDTMGVFTPYGYISLTANGSDPWHPPLFDSFFDPSGLYFVPAASWDGEGWDMPGPTERFEIHADGSVTVESTDALNRDEDGYRVEHTNTWEDVPPWTCSVSGYRIYEDTVECTTGNTGTHTLRQELYGYDCTLPAHDQVDDHTDYGAEEAVFEWTLWGGDPDGLMETRETQRVAHDYRKRSYSEATSKVTITSDITRWGIAYCTNMSSTYSASGEVETQGGEETFFADSDVSGSIPGFVAIGPHRFPRLNWVDSTYSPHQYKRPDRYHLNNSINDPFQYGDTFDGGFTNYDTLTYDEEYHAKYKSLAPYPDEPEYEWMSSEPSIRLFTEFGSSVSVANGLLKAFQLKCAWRTLPDDTPGTAEAMAQQGSYVWDQKVAEPSYSGSTFDYVFGEHNTCKPTADGCGIVAYRYKINWTTGEREYHKYFGVYNGVVTDLTELLKQAPDDDGNHDPALESYEQDRWFEMRTRLVALRPLAGEAQPVSLNAEGKTFAIEGRAPLVIDPWDSGWVDERAPVQFGGPCGEGKEGTDDGGGGTPIVEVLTVTQAFHPANRTTLAILSTDTDDEYVHLANWIEDAPVLHPSATVLSTVNAQTATTGVSATYGEATDNGYTIDFHVSTSTRPYQAEVIIGLMELWGGSQFPYLHQYRHHLGQT